VLINGKTVVISFLGYYVVVKFWNN